VKKLIVGGALLLLVGIGIGGLIQPDAQWSGVDESVVKKFAEQAGRPPREPYINVAQGDVLLFCFLLAGIVGGFTAGYYYRELFPPQTKSVSQAPNV